MNTVSNLTRRTASFDVVVVVGTCVGYMAAEAAGVPKRWSYLGAGVVLLLFLAIVIRRRSDSARDLGLRADNLRAAAPVYGLVTAALAGAVVIWALALGRSPLDASVLPLLALYPAWALVQQLAFQGILHRRLATLTRRPALSVAITSVCFASVHFGSPLLVGLTFVAGVVWSVLFMRWPNLWLLAASHTVLAALAYPLVVGDAPLSRI